MPTRPDVRWAVASPVTRATRGDRDPTDVPRELQRRLLLSAFSEFGARRPRGPELSRAMDVLAKGGSTTLGGLRLQGGALWRLRLAPPRR